MKIFTFLFLASLLVANDVLLPEDTAAVVNGIAITEDELSREVAKLIPRTYIHTNVDKEKKDIVRKKALVNLIDNTLLYSYALKSNLTVSDKEVEDMISIIRDRYDSSEIYNKALKNSYFTPNTLRSAIKKDEILKKLYIKEVEVNYSDNELKNYYNKNKYKFKEPEKIRVRIIYVKNNPKDPNGKEKAKKRIKEAEELLKKGENFAYVAQTYSNDPTRVKGGDMGYLHRGRLEKAVEDKAFSMDINTISDIIKQDIGYFIVKVEDKKKQNQLAFKTVKDRLKKELKKKEEDKRKAKLLEKLMLNAVIVK